MPSLKLSKLPNRTPVKITITVAPEVNAALQAYAELYREAYGENEPVAALIPYMLESFLAADRGFARARKGKLFDGSRSEEHTSELQSLMRISYAVFCLKKKTSNT